MIKEIISTDCPGNAPTGVRRVDRGGRIDRFFTQVEQDSEDLAGGYAIGDYLVFHGRER